MWVLVEVSRSPALHVFRKRPGGGTLPAPRSLLVAAFVAVVIVSAGTWALLGPHTGGGMSGPRSEHPVAIPETARTVTVSVTMPGPSAHERRLSAMLEKGTMPPEATMAEVMTDTECAPDGKMISRCRNEMRLADGRTMVLRHPHDMSKVPCLAPGERVLLVPSSA
jgi:hypothetical protein